MTNPHTPPTDRDWADLTARVAASSDPLIALRGDQASRWQAGTPVPAEAYLDRFPDLTPDDALALIVAEAQLRRERGEVIDPGEYRRRFPHHSTELDAQFELLRVGPATTERTAVRSADRTGPYVDASPPDLPTVPGLPAVPGYEITGEIGRGGMGLVLAGRDPTLGRDVAIKVLLGARAGVEAARRFVRETRITAALPHPGVPPVYATGVLDDGSPFLAMKRIRGKTLSVLLRARPSPAHDLPRFVQTVEQIAQAVGYAHSRGIVHRDLKPANVMVGAFGEVQVMDWGLAGRTDEARPPDSEVSVGVGYGPDASSVIDHSALTARGAVMGTPAFMAPEQARGESAGPPADVFALGGILCEVLTGFPTFRGGSGHEVVGKAAAGDVSDARARLDACGADADLVALAVRCLAPAASDRPADCGAVADAVAAYRAGVEGRLRRAEQETAAADARAVVQRKKRRVERALAVAVAVLVLGGAAAGWWQQKQAARQQQQEDAATAQRERNGDAIGHFVDQCEYALRVADDPTAAARALAEIDRRFGEGGGDAYADRIARCRTDTAALAELDRIDEARWAVGADGQLLPEDVDVAAWVKLFTSLGIVPGETPDTDAARQIEGSLIRERLLGALDLWHLTVVEPGSPLHAPIRRLLSVADPDPYRTQVRVEIAAPDAGKRLPELATSPAATRQPPRFAVVLGSLASLPLSVREKVLIAVVGNRPDQFTVIMTLAEVSAMSAIDSDAEQPKWKQVRWYQAALALRPNSAAALSNMGFVLNNLGLREEALTCLRRGAAVSPDFVPMLNNLALALDASGDAEGAVAVYRRAVALDPDFVQPRTNLGLLLIRRGEPAAALPHLEAAARLRPSSADAKNNVGQARRALGDLDGAVRDYQTALKLKSSSAMAHSNLGEALLAKGESERATECFARAILHNPKLAAAHNNFGYQLNAKGLRDAAIVHYREAIRLKPSADAHNNLGIALHGRGEDGPALAEYDAALRLDPKYAQAHLNRGSMLEERGEVDAAIGCYREAIRLNPKLAMPHYNLGIALGTKGETDAAVASYREAIRLDPKYAPAHVNLGKELEVKGGPQAGVPHYREAVRLDPKLPNAHTNLGVAYAAAGEPAKALACYREAVRVAPEYATGHYNLGLALHKPDTLAEAIASLREAIRLDPKSAAAHYALGNTLRDSGEPAAAIASYRAAIAADPNLALAHNNLGVALRARGDADGAAASFREVTRLTPDDAPAHYNLGNALAAKADRLGNTAAGRTEREAAIASYKEAIRIRPGLHQAHTNLGNAYKAKGDADAALASYREAVRLAPKSVGAWCNLGSTLSDRREFPAAIAAYEEALRLDPRDALTHFEFGNVHLARLDYDAAIASHREAVRLNPRLAEAHQNLGAGYVGKKDYAAAVGVFEAAQRLHPNHAAIRANLAIARKLLADQEARTAPPPRPVERP